MKCPICGERLLPGTDRCPSCGYRCTNTKPNTAPRDSAPASRPSAAPYTPPRKSGPSAGCFCAAAVLIPVVLLLVVIISVTFQTVREVLTVPAPEPGFFEDLLPGEDLDPADENCFRIHDHSLYFEEESWDGSPILRVPETVHGQEVYALGPGCFADCAGLTTILIPGTVTDIGDNAFSGCSSLRGLFLPEGLETIGKDAFSGCGELEAIYIPDTVERIEPGCFDDCAGLLYIFYNGSFESWDELYGDYINPFTTAICLDGNYFHGAVD